MMGGSAMRTIPSLNFYCTTNGTRSGGKEAGEKRTATYQLVIFALPALWNANKEMSLRGGRRTRLTRTMMGRKRVKFAFTNFTKGKARPPKYHKRWEHDRTAPRRENAVEGSSHHVHLPKVGGVKTFERSQFARHIERRGYGACHRDDRIPRVG